MALFKNHHERGAKRWKKWKFAPTLRAILHPFFVNPRPSLFPSTIDASLSFLLSISFNIRSIFNIFFLGDYHLRHVWFQVSSSRIRLMFYSMFTFYLSLILSWLSSWIIRYHYTVSYSAKEKAHHLLTIFFLNKKHLYMIIMVLLLRISVQFKIMSKIFELWIFRNDIS